MATMHDGELEISIPLVRRLIAAQFPQWSHLSIERVVSSGTDNAMFRLGDTLVARLPRVSWAADQAVKEQRWLPVLAPHLPIDIPNILGAGKAGEGFPWDWSVLEWIDGETATLDRIADTQLAAVNLAQFILALQSIDASDGPHPGQHNSWRGVQLARRDEAVRSSLASLEGRINCEAATAIWENCLAAPVWDGEPVWIHGDIQSGNLLALDSRIKAVIDFGCLGVGDPACDLLVAWNLLPSTERKVFRQALGVDDATWARGRGWAVSVALIALPYYWDTNPAMAASSRFTLEQVLAECN